MKVVCVCVCTAYALPGIFCTHWSLLSLLCWECPCFYLQATPSRYLYTTCTLVCSTFPFEMRHTVSTSSPTRSKHSASIPVKCFFPPSSLCEKAGSQPQLFLKSPISMKSFQNLCQLCFPTTSSAYSLPVLPKSPPILTWNNQKPTYLAASSSLASLNHPSHRCQPSLSKGKRAHCTSLLKSLS